jgi:hypothetical protein
MDTPPIQYVKTSDGVSIAYYTMGSGQATPIVWIDLPSHLHIERTLFPDQLRSVQGDVTCRHTRAIRPSRVWPVGPERHRVSAR